MSDVEQEEVVATVLPVAAPAPLALPVEAEAPTPSVVDLPPAKLRQIVEGLLFVAQRPLTTERLAACLPGCEVRWLDGFLHGLTERFAYEERGWDLRRIANGWQLLTRASVHPWARLLDRRDLPDRLSKSALETLSTVAYRQPITRGAIEDIRGVQCGPVLRQLMDLRLVQVAGRDEEALGRPLLYRTTDHFLQRFGLASVDDLPKAHEFGV